MARSYVYNGTEWIKEDMLLPQDAETISYDNTESGLEAETVQDAIDEVTEKKQDSLTAGDNITIIDNVISATGGSGGIPLSPTSTVEFALGYDANGFYVETESDE